MSDSEKRFVRNRTDHGVYLRGYGVIQPGKDGVEVDASPNLDAAIEAKVLEDAPKPTAKTTTKKEGGTNESA